MYFKKINPVTSGTRHQINLKKNLLSKKNNIIKLLFKNIKSNSSRSSSTGQITVRHKGGRIRKNIHLLTFKNQCRAFTICHFYSSFHTSFISLNFDIDQRIFFKSTSTNKLFPGSFNVSQNSIKNFYIGYRAQLHSFPIGSVLHSISLKNNIIYGCSAGVFCQLLERRVFSKIRLPSGKIIILSNFCFGVLGSVSNSDFKSTVVGKAGRNRLKGKRCSVRGIAMNPVDHPHGGRTNGGCTPVTP